MSSVKKTILIIVALFIVTVVVVAYIQQDEQLRGQDISQWSSYVNQEYKFGFKYPPGYKVFVQQPTNGKANGQILVRAEEGLFDKPFFYITLPVSGDSTMNPNAKSLADFMIPQYKKGSHTIVIKSSELKEINSFQSVKQSYQEGELVNGELRLEGLESTLNGLRYVFYDGKKMFIVIKTEKKYEAFIDLIASTFKFIK